jgi:hypothetical protein
MIVKTSNKYDCDSIGALNGWNFEKTQITTSVTELNDVTNAGSGAIITTDERTKLNDAVTLTDNQTISGSKTFSSDIIMDCNKNGQYLSSNSNGLILNRSSKALNIDYDNLLSTVTAASDFNALKQALIDAFTIYRNLENVLQNMIITQNSTFLTEKFLLTFDLKNSYVGNSLYHIPNNDENGTKSNLDNIYNNAPYNGSYNSYMNYTDISKAKLIYIDPEHYELEILESFTDKVYFKGSEIQAPGSITEINWRINYCTTPGNSSTKFSTILFGKRVGNCLQILPKISGQSLEFTVNGSSGQQVGIPLVGITQLYIDYNN